MLVTVRYEKRATCEEETIVGIRETEGKIGDMGAWLNTLSAGEYTACVVLMSTSLLDYLCKETIMLLPCYDIYCDIYCI